MRVAHFDGIVYVRRRVGSTTALDLPKVGGPGDFVLHTDGRSGDILDGAVVVKRNVAGNSEIAVNAGDHWRNSGPENDRVRVRISGSDSMGEVQLRSSVLRAGYVALVHFVKRNTQTGMVLRRTTIVDVLGPASKSYRAQC